MNLAHSLEGLARSVGDDFSRQAPDDADLLVRRVKRGRVVWTVKTGAVATVAVGAVAFGAPAIARAVTADDALAPAASGTPSASQGVESSLASVEPSTSVRASGDASTSPSPVLPTASAPSSSDDHGGTAGHDDDDDDNSGAHLPGSTTVPLPSPVSTDGPGHDVGDDHGGDDSGDDSEDSSGSGDSSGDDSSGRDHPEDD